MDIELREFVTLIFYGSILIITGELERQMNRRDFFEQGLLAAACTALGGQAWAASLASPSVTGRDHSAFLEFIRRSGKSSNLSMTGIDPTIAFFHQPKTGRIPPGNTGLAFFNDAGESAILDAPIFVHSIEQNPDALERIMLIPRAKGTCFEYDVYANKVTHTLNLGARNFYGHGCYVPGTNHFYSAAVSADTYDTSIVQFNYKTGKLLREISVPGGAGAHQCSLSRDGRHLIMTFTRKTATHSPSIVWIDITSGSIVDRVLNLPEQTEHFSELSDGYVVFAGGHDSEEAETILGRLDPKRQPQLVEPGKEFGPHFRAVSSSICAVEEKSLAFITNVSQDSVFVINYKTGAPVKRIAINAPRGLALSGDRRRLFVTSLVDTESDISRVTVCDVESLQKVSEFSIPKTKAYANHISRFRPK